MISFVGSDGSKQPEEILVNGIDDQRNKSSSRSKCFPIENRKTAQERGSVQTVSLRSIDRDNKIDGAECGISFKRYDIITQRKANITA